MATLSSDSLVSSIQSEIQRVTDDLKGVDENLKRLTGRDFNEPRGERERRIRLSSGGGGGGVGGGAREGREDEPPPKRRPPGGVFARLGEPVTDVHRGRRVHEVSEEEGELPRHKPSVASSVARPVVDGKSRTEAAAELTKDKASRERNRRMFGALLGTLQRFRTEEAKQRGKDEQRAKIEKKLEEKGRAEKEKLQREKMDLISQRKERQARIKRLHFKMERVKEHEMWEEHQKKLERFIRTHSKPHIFWMPKVLQSRTSQLISDTKESIERELEEARIRLKEELDEVLGGRRGLPLREDEGEEEEKEREREGHSMDFNNGTDILDYDAEEGELVFEDDLLASGKKRERGQRVVVQVESSVNRAPQRRVELVTVVAPDRNKRGREMEGSESEKENVLRSKVSVEYRNGDEGGVGDKMRGGVKEREKGGEGDKGRDRGREKASERRREKSGGKGKEKDKGRDKDRERERGKEREREKEKKRKEKEAERERERTKGRDVDKGKSHHPKETLVKREPKSGAAKKTRGDGGVEPHPEDPEPSEGPTSDPEGETWAEDLSHISLPIEPEPEPEQEAQMEVEPEPEPEPEEPEEEEEGPAPVPSMREVVVQHVPRDAAPGGDGGSMQVETVQLVLDTSAIKKDPGVGAEEGPHPPIVIIKKEKDASPPRIKGDPEAAPEPQPKGAESESSDSSSESEEEESSSESAEGEGGEEEEEESSSSASSSSSSSSSSSESEDEKKKKKSKGKKKTSEKEKTAARKRKKGESKSSSSSSSSSSSDSDTGSSDGSPRKKRSRGGRRSSPSPAKGSRRGAEKGSDKRRGGGGGGRRSSRSKSRERRRDRSRSRDRRRGRK